MKKYVITKSRCPKCGKSEEKMGLSCENSFNTTGTGGFVKVTRLSTCCFVDEDRWILVTVCPDGCLMVGIEK